MTLHEQFLEQSRHLATRDPRRPQQGNLRRAVSTAYYALFHFLVDRASRFLVGSSGERGPLRKLLSRAFTHTEVASACKSFGGGTLPSAMARHFAGLTIPPEVRSLADHSTLPSSFGTLPTMISRNHSTGAKSSR